MSTTYKLLNVKTGKNCKIFDISAHYVSNGQESNEIKSFIASNKNDPFSPSYSSRYADFYSYHLNTDIHTIVDAKSIPMKYATTNEDADLYFPEEVLDNKYVNSLSSGVMLNGNLYSLTMPSGKQMRYMTSILSNYARGNIYAYLSSQLNVYVSPFTFLYKNNIQDMQRLSADILKKYDLFQLDIDLEDQLYYLHQFYKAKYYNVISSLYTSDNGIYNKYDTTDVLYKEYTSDGNIDMSDFDDTSLFKEICISSFIETLNDPEISCSMNTNKQKAYDKSFFFNYVNKKKRNKLTIDEEQLDYPLSSHIAGAFCRVLEAGVAVSDTDNGFLNSSTPIDVYSEGSELNTSLYNDLLNLLSLAKEKIKDATAQIDTAKTQYFNIDSVHGHGGSNTAANKSSVSSSAAYTQYDSLPDLTKGSVLLPYYKSQFNRAYKDKMPGVGAVQDATEQPSNPLNFTLYETLETAIHEQNLAYKMYKIAYDVAASYLVKTVKNMPEMLQFNIKSRVAKESDSDKNLVAINNIDHNAGNVTLYVEKSDSSLEEAIDELSELIEQNKDNFVLNDVITRNIAIKNSFTDGFSSNRSYKFVDAIVGSNIKAIADDNNTIRLARSINAANSKLTSDNIGYSVLSNKLQGRHFNKYITSKVASGVDSTHKQANAALVGVFASNANAATQSDYWYSASDSYTTNFSRELATNFIKTGTPFVQTTGNPFTPNYAWLSSNMFGYMDFSGIYTTLSSMALESLNVYYNQQDILDSICDKFVQTQSDVRNYISYELEITQDENGADIIDLYSNIENNEYLNVLNEYLANEIESAVYRDDVVQSNNRQLIDSILSDYFKETADKNVYSQPLLNEKILNHLDNIDVTNISNYTYSGIVVYKNKQKLFKMLYSAYEQYQNNFASDFQADSILNTMSYVPNEYEIDSEYLLKLVDGVDVEDVDLFGHTTTYQRKIRSYQDIFLEMYSDVSDAVNLYFKDAIKSSITKCAIDAVLNTMSQNALYDSYDTVYVYKNISRRLAVEYLYNQHSIESMYSNNVPLSNIDSTEYEKYWISWMYGIYCRENVMMETNVPYEKSYLPLLKKSDFTSNFLLEYEMFYQTVILTKVEDFMNLASIDSTIDTVFINLFNNFIAKVFPGLVIHSLTNENNDIVYNFSSNLLEEINNEYSQSIFTIKPAKFKKILQDNFDSKLMPYYTVDGILIEFRKRLLTFIEEGLLKYYEEYERAKRQQMVDGIQTLQSIQDNKYSLSNDMFKIDNVDYQFVDDIDAQLNTSKYDLQLRSSTQNMSIYNRPEYESLEIAVNEAIDDLIKKKLEDDIKAMTITAYNFIPLSSQLKTKLLDTYLATLYADYAELDNQLNVKINSLDRTIENIYNDFLRKFMKEHIDELSTANFFKYLVEVDKIASGIAYNTILEFPLDYNAAEIIDGYINVNPATAKNLYDDKYSIDIQNYVTSPLTSFSIDRTRKYYKIGACGNNVFLVYDNTIRYDMVQDTTDTGIAIKQKSGATKFYVNAKDTESHSLYDTIKKVEVIKTIDANSAGSSQHKSNLYSIDIFGTGLNDNNTNDSKIKQQIKNKISQYVEQLMPLHTQLYNINVN